MQLKYCAATDYWSSPRIDAMKQEVGRRFEVYLESVLREAGLPFETEDDARCVQVAATTPLLHCAEDIYLLSIRWFSVLCSCSRLGRSRTPDVVLQVPIGVVGPDGGAHVVFWIDGKAMFGDWEGHVEERQAQVRSSSLTAETQASPISSIFHSPASLAQLDAYVNRFGPGMVIYWFDHLDAVRTTRCVPLVATSCVCRST